MEQRNKLAIIIPAYNEEKRIGKTLEEYCNFFKSKKKQKELDFEIIIVINNTTDKTEEIVKSYQKKFKELKYLNFKQGGKGFAIIEGFKEALRDKNNYLMGFVDADMATAPEAFYDLVKNINGFDGVIASRYINKAIVNPKPSIQRIIASRIFNFLVRSLFFLKFRDTQCGAKLFKRRAVEAIINEIDITQWAFDVDLLYKIKKHKFKIKEHPTVWREKDSSKLNLKKASLEMFLAIIRLRIINSRFKKFYRPLSYFEKIIYPYLK